MGDVSWYIPHYTPNISQQKIRLEHIVSRTATEIRYIKRSSHTKDETTENNRTSELGVENDIDVPIYVIVGFI